MQGTSLKSEQIRQADPGVENCYVFKSRLQEYTQKVGLQTPQYHTMKEGPSHEPIFKSIVIINNVKYDSLPGFFNRKAAEQSAAEVALMEIVKSVQANEGIPAVHETGLCKNLLQEYAQKMNFAIPSYICTRQASGLAPFICTVEIGGIQYIGAAARTKKEAEIKAARTALLAIQGQSEGCANGATKYIVVPGKRPCKETEKRSMETPKPLKAKKAGLKKKWNKRKFMKKNEQAVDTEKDDAGDAEDVHNSDVPINTTITQVPSGGGTAMLQPNGEAGNIKQVVMLQPNIEAITTKQGPPGETAMLQPDEEVRIIKQETPSNILMLQPNNEARIIEQEPLGDAALLQTKNGPKVENSESVCHQKSQSAADGASLKTNGTFGDVPRMDLDPSSTAVSTE